PGLVALQPLLRLAQPLERLVRLRAAIPRAIRRRAPHRISSVLQPLHRVAQFLLPLLIARELLQLTRRLLDFVRELTLQIAGIARSLSLLRQPALTLHLLLLPPRQFLQLLDQLIDLLIVPLLLRARLHLVLVRELVQLQLEQIGEVLGHLVLTATSATAPAVLHRHLQLVLLLGVLQQLQRTLLGRERRVGLQRLQVGLGRLHFLRRPRQRFGNLVERGID